MTQETLNKKILFVDDDVNILSAFQRSLRGSFEIVGALGGEKALQELETKGPFAVIVSDLRMPRMGGMEFLARAYEVSPASIQLVLSGTAEVSVAIEALNQGRIFRFLTKPCAPDVLAATLTAALNQYQLGITQKSIMETQLQGDSAEILDSLKALVETGKQRIAELAQTGESIQSDSPAASSTDPLTGLFGPDAACLAIATALASDSPPQLAVFSVQRMEFMRSRYGQAVSDQVMLLASQHLATNAELTGDTLYRWKGKSDFIALLARPEPLEAVKLDLQRSLSNPINQFFETMSRCVFLPIKITVDAFSLAHASMDEVDARIEAFSSMGN
ncbi:MAG: response regulator [Acidobacteriota bacterium]